MGETEERKGKMSALFARIVKQAIITFERDNYAMFGTNFNTLKQLVDQLTTNDLHISPELLNSKSFQSSARAPVKYLELFEHQTFTMSVFIVANKYTMPLHDHPEHGLLKVISGTARIQSFTLERPMDSMPSNLLRVIEETPSEYSIKSECSILTPTKCNIHEITATGYDPVAFFDILSPPYESELSMYGPKKCFFYRKVPLKSTSTGIGIDDQSNDSCSDTTTVDKTNPKKYAYLQQIRVPSHYYCDDIHYKPPKFLQNMNYLNSYLSGEAL